MAGKEYGSDELADRVFAITMAGIGLFIVVVFAFVL